ncbi:MAG: glycosyltransferase [Rhodocyclaceae bacterium]|nr:MAG: glycosyltransferase [Rhodocyclaceae bacterium]
MTVPLVSIAIPAYRHAKYIETCLASVCAQTYPELELVLIDDGSPDDTFEIAQRFLANHAGRFRRVVLERRENRGVSANSNACIEACQGEWVHLLGSDDRLYPEKVAKIQAAIAGWNCPELALVHTDTDTIDADGVIRPVRRPGLHADAGVDRAAYRWLFHRNLISNPSIALRREAFLAIGGFDPALPLEDIDCWLRLSARHAIARLPETLASYRKHPGNSLRQRRKMLGAFFLTYAKFIDLHPGLIDDAALRRHFRRNLRRYWTRIRDDDRGDLPQVIASFLRSYLRTPGAGDYRRFGQRLLNAAN